MKIELFGLANCDKVKKAKSWLQQHQHSFDFIDIRKTPLTENSWEKWLQQISLDKLLNKKSTSWRQLSSEQQNFNSHSEAITLLLKYPTLMKRPVLVIDDKIIEVGFISNNYHLVFNKK